MERRELVRADLMRMHIPEEHWKARSDRASAEVRPVVERYLRHISRMIAEGASLLIHGPAGVGKTSIAAMIAKEARSTYHTVLFCRIWELREMIRSRVEFDADSTIAERCREVQVLVLDDLREEDARERFFTLSEIQQLVLYRASRRRLTIVTTRLDKSTLTDAPLDRFADVLLPFAVTGPNQHNERQRKVQQMIHGKGGVEE
jgi:DNA replication protein DnaC